MIKPARIFGSHMTLQREKNVVIWGESDPHAKISVSISDVDDSYVGEADETGNWKITMPGHPAATNLTMKVSAEEEAIEYEDVRFGEVWLAGGQSNMEFLLAYDEEQSKVLNANNPQITFFDYPKVSYAGELENMDYHRFGLWRECNPENNKYCSAAAFYFASKLQEELKVPIGIVSCNWGGTPACAWMPADALKGTLAEVWIKEYEEGLEKIDINQYKASFHHNPGNDHTNPFADNMAANMQRRLMYPGLNWEEQLKMLGYMKQYNAGNSEAQTAIGPWSERRPGGLYENMLIKIAPYVVRGVIFYQGESDDLHPELYTCTLEKLISSWRTLWKEQLPFLMVQLAPFERWLETNGKAFPVLRKAQEDVVREMDDVYMCSSSDCGMKDDVHPKKKRPIGERLALLACEHIYDQDVMSDPPEIQDAVYDKSYIKLSFRNAAGLRVIGNEISDLEIVNHEGKLNPIVRHEIKEDELYLYGDFSDACIVLLGNKPYYEVNLYNCMKNPVKPFKKYLKQEIK